MTDQDQRAARIFQNLETDRRAHDDRVRKDPSFTAASHPAAAHKPVVNPSTVARRPSATPSPVALRRGRYQPVRLLGGTGKELCEGEVLFQVERGGEHRGDPQVHRWDIEELLWGSHWRKVPVHLKPSKWHERCLPARPPPRTKVPCPRWSATNRRRWDSRATASWPR